MSGSCTESGILRSAWKVARLLMGEGQNLDSVLRTLETFGKKEDDICND